MVIQKPQRETDLRHLAQYVIENMDQYVNIN